jgi:hypothetical protein
MSDAIIVVHGVGEQQKTATLRRFANGLIEFLYGQLGNQKIDPATLQAEIDLENSRVHLKFRDEDQVADIIVSETWWAKAFQPPDLAGVSHWLVLSIFDNFREAFRSLNLNPASWAYAAFSLLLLPVFSILLLLILYGIRLTVALPLISQPAKAVFLSFQKGAGDLLVSVVGDVQVYATDWVYSTDIREQLEKAITDLATLEDVTAIHIVGHSLGGIIAYETLTRTPSLAAQPKIKSLFTIGSPLDKVGLFLNRKHRFRFQSELPEQVEWVNVYSPSDLISDRLKKFDIRPTNVRVTNKPIFLFFKEHSSYWQNPEVMWQIVSRVSNTTQLAAQPTKTMGSRFRQAAQFYLPKQFG